MDDKQISEIFNKISNGVKISLGDKWKEARIFAESEAKKFALNIAEITEWKIRGEINEEQAKVLIRMHQRSMKMVLTSLEGISLVLAERAINAAIEAISDMVNGIIGFKIF